MPTLTLDQAEELVVATLTRCRTAPDNARSVAHALIAAEADGLKGHGLSRVPTYAAQSKAGKVDGFARPTIEWRRPAVAAIDAANGFAYPAIELAVAALPQAARQNGIASVAIRRSHHCGAAGHPVERLAEIGLVGLMFANTPAAIAPWGGNRGVFGTNPIAFACPLSGRAPIVVDLSVSKVARGNILAAKQKGEPIPAGWALDGNGKPTTDPDAALAGTMLPLGDAKGTALALMVELLAAGLTGANFAADASSFLDAKGPPPVFVSVPPALVVDLLSFIKPKAVIMLGLCGGLRDEYRVGDFFNPVAAIRNEGTSNSYMPPQCPALSSFVLQRLACEELEKQKLKYHTGVIHTTNVRFWEFNEEFKASLAVERAQAIDMECATLFIVGYARRVPVGALMLISDVPLQRGGIKTAESAKKLFEKYTGQHIDVGINALKTAQEREKAGGLDFRF